MIFSKKKSNKSLVSIVLGSYNRRDFLKLTIDSVRKELNNILHEIIVVDGGSTDGALQWLLKQKDIITIVQHNRGEWQGKKIERKSWGYFMNLAFRAASSKYICMLSDDCLVIPGAIKNGYELFEKELNNGKKIGAVAFYWRDWGIQEKYHVGYTLGNKLYVNHGMYLKKALDDVGYIDEQTYHFYNGDGDLCLKIWQKGYAVIKSEDSYIEHYPHANVRVRKSNYEKQKLDNLRYFSKWDGIFYNKKEHNIGKYEEKDFIDKTFTGNKFKIIHKNILSINPAILKNKLKNNFLKIILKFSPLFLRKKLSFLKRYF